MRRLLEQLPDDLRSHALTHAVFAASHALSYERLEFLGDSVLGLAITEELYRRFPELPEGELTRVRAGTVSRDACAHVARASGLGEAMVAHAADESAAAAAAAKRVAEQRNALAALTESIIGAGHLSLGYEAVARHIVAAFEDRIVHAFENRVDARSRLQELASATGAEITWIEVGEEGPPHDRSFTAAVEVHAKRAEGVGRSKQEAQRAAAAAMLTTLEDQG